MIPAPLGPDPLDSLDFTLGRYDREVRPQLGFPGGSAAEIHAWEERARAQLCQLIGGQDAEAVPLDPAFDAPVVRPGYTRRAVRFATRPGLQAFGYLLVPETRQDRAPAVLCLPGHGRGAAELVGLDAEGRDREDPDNYQHDFALQCVRRGSVTLALEMLGFGQRRDPAARARGPGASSCQPSAGAALLLGETMVGWRTWDARRALDLLSSLPEVDPARLALMGISGGGTVGLYTAALDARVKVSVLSGSFCSVRDSIYSVAHCIDNYVPGLLRWFETADLAGLIAPRALFVEAGRSDEIFPEPGVRAALARTSAIYAARQAGGRLDAEFFDAGHQFHGVRAFERLAEWL